MADVTDVGQQRQHEEQAAEDVLPLGHPGHRFRPQRMDGEDGRHEGAGPEIAGHPPEGEEEQNRGGGVQQQIGGVVSAGVRSVELVVQNVGEPRQRMPVAGMAGCEGPADFLGDRTLNDMRIFVDVFVVVVVDELVMDRLAEDQSNRQQQETADGPCRVDIPRRRP